MRYDKFIGGLLILLSCIAFLAFFAYRVSLLFLPTPDLGGVENNVIYFIQRLITGESLYSNPSNPPYAIAQYGPIYYYVCAAIAKIFGVGADDVLNVFISSRVLSLICNVLYCFALV